MSAKDTGGSACCTDAFHDGVILALQVLNAGGDCGGAHYEELVNCCGLDELYARARTEEMLVLSGLREYRRTHRKALAARMEPQS